MNKHAFKKATETNEVPSKLSMVASQPESREEKPGYKCDQCDHVATKKMSLKLHVQVKHEGLRFPCDHCDYKATQKQRLKAHIVEKHAGLMFSCDQCELKAWFKIEITDHTRSIHENNPYLCDLCDFKTNQSGGLQTHLQSHCNFCELCDFVGISKKVLKTHNKNVHENSASSDKKVEDDPMENPLTRVTCTWCLGDRPMGASDCGPLQDACRAAYPDFNREFVEMSFEQF